MARNRALNPVFLSSILLVFVVYYLSACYLCLMDDSEFLNFQKLETEQASLDDWRYRIVSALLVASSAILALSFAQQPADTGNQCIRVFRRVALIANSSHILSCAIAFGALLYIRKNRVDTLRSILGKPVYNRQVYLLSQRIARGVLRASVIFSFVSFAALAVALTVCGFLSS